MSSPAGRTGKRKLHSRISMAIFATHKLMLMRIILAMLLLAVTAFSLSLGSCNSSGPATFCDTTCQNDTISFRLDHPDQPYVSIGMKNCKPDTITWSHNRITAKRKVEFPFLTGKEVHINKSHMRHYIKDTSYAWLVFNDCITGQGFITKIPFNKTDAIVRKNSAFNSFDPKFIVDESLVAYTDKGNLFIEEMSTGKKATMTFGRQVDMDYTAIHETIDSVIVTPQKARVRIKIDNEWEVIEKDITLK